MKEEVGGLYKNRLLCAQDFFKAPAGPQAQQQNGNSAVVDSSSDHSSSASETEGGQGGEEEEANEHDLFPNAGTPDARAANEAMRSLFRPGPGASSSSSGAGPSVPLPSYHQLYEKGRRKEWESFMKTVADHEREEREAGRPTWSAGGVRPGQSSGADADASMEEEPPPNPAEEAVDVLVTASSESGSDVGWPGTPLQGPTPHQSEDEGAEEPEEDEAEEEEEAEDSDSSSSDSEEEEEEDVDEELRHLNAGFIESSTHCIHAVVCELAAGMVLATNGTRYKVRCNSGTLRHGTFHAHIGPLTGKMWGCPKCQEQI
jgi:hypothetical protein